MEGCGWFLPWAFLHIAITAFMPTLPNEFGDSENWPPRYVQITNILKWSRCLSVVTSSYQRTLMMAYDTQYRWVSGHCTSPCVLKLRKHKVYETGTVFFPQAKEGSHLLRLVSLKELTLITAQPMSKFRFELNYDRRSVGQSVLV
jgi:hypothetical protein